MAGQNETHEPSLGEEQPTSFDRGIVESGDRAVDVTPRCDARAQDVAAAMAASKPSGYASSQLKRANRERLQSVDCGMTAFLDRPVSGCRSLFGSHDWPSAGVAGDAGLRDSRREALWKTS